MKRIILALLVLAMTAINSRAQLKYHSNGKLTFGTTTLPISSYATRFEGWGHYFSYGSKFLEFCVATSGPRIAGTANQIVFFNSETSTFNSIKVASVVNASDRRLKTNIAPLNKGLQTVMQLRPVSYDWKNPGNGLATKEGVAQKGMGFVAQDVETILPQLVSSGPEDVKMLNYIGLIPVLTKSIQELSAEVEALKAEIATLKTSKDASDISK